MLAITNLKKSFNKGKATEVMALRGINLEIKTAEFVVIVGANGSGKSTLLNSIAGRVLPDSGEVIIENTKVTRLAEHRRSKWIARVFQDPLSGTASELSILENFRLATLRTKPKLLNIGITAAFEKQVYDQVAQLGMGLEGKLHLPMGALSGGQRQALTLLMAVMDDVRVLLLDEPTAALDPRSAEMVMKIADKLISSYNLTAILITHNMKEAFTYGNRIIQMAEGKIVRDLNLPEKGNLSHTDLYEWFM
ncbi:MAG: ATP-binding cassette domain-containing protein [Sphingobacteriaceae bacterium]|nr:ATP-binding cassette domain-containing protein [Sphingobacteriaceae bacterium]